MQRNPYEQYRTTHVLTASTGDLILLLYDGAIRSLGLAELALQDGRVGDAHERLINAQQIILELFSGLNYELGGELAQNLRGLYLYMHRILVQANLAKDIVRTREIAALLTQLRDAWRQAVNTPSQPSKPAGDAYRSGSTGVELRA